MQRDIATIREEIDRVDMDILELMVHRRALSEEVAEYKFRAGRKICDQVREKEKLEALKRLSGDRSLARSLEALFTQIMNISRSRQYEMLSERRGDFSDFEIGGEPSSRICSVIYQGMPGAYGHQAASAYFSPKCNFLCGASFDEVMKKVASGEAEYGLLPAENSSTGIIDEVYDLLSTYDVFIAGEYELKIEHALLGLKGSSEDDIRTVYSHPQGLLQCSAYLSGHPEWKRISMENTAVSAKKVLDEGDRSQAAIAGSVNAMYYGLELLREGINDNENNSTRFIVIGSKREYSESADTVSISFELNHESGSLYHILGFIIYNNLNMTRIESRPIAGEKWKYRFFIDFQGNLSQAPVRYALTAIIEESENFRILGNYSGA